MNGFWKLTNVLFGWMMRKRGGIVLLSSLAFGLAGILVQSFPKAASKRDVVHLAESFLPYERIVDGSGVGVVFLLGLLLLFLIIFLTANRFFTNGKGIYTLLMLPMKRNEIYFSFLTAGAAMLFLYFASWLILMAALYFPVMANYTRVAAQEVFRVSDGFTLQALDAARENGLYLAFRKSVFLSSCFPSSLWQFLALGLGLLLVLVSVLYGGLRVGERGGQVMVMLVGSALGIYTAATPFVYMNGIGETTGFLLGLLFSGWFVGTSVGITLLFCIPTLFGVCLVIRLTLKDMNGKIV